MKKLLASACAAGFLASAQPLYANEFDEIYYTGTFQCSGTRYSTDWTITKELGGQGIAAIVYYQRTDSSRVEWLELTERTGTAANSLDDANGNPRLGIVAEGKTIRATWMKGAPSGECGPFDVTRSESPGNRYDKLFALLSASEPDDATAMEVAEMSPPIIYALPELDQQTYHQRHGELKESFWQRYVDGLVGYVSTVRMDRPEERQAFADRLNGALEGPFYHSLKHYRFDKIHDAWQKAVDRYAASGGSPANELYGGSAHSCQRLTAIIEVEPGYNFGKLEFAVGVPSDYWTRDLAENLLRDLRDCNTQAGQTYAGELPRKWPEIQNQQQLARALRAEQARLLSLPLTVETLVESRNLQPDAEIVSGVSRSSIIYDRYFGSPLEARRAELIQANIAAVVEQSADYSLEKPELAASVTQACEALKGSLPREKREMVAETCDNALAFIADKQKLEAIAQVKVAFANVEPGSEEAKTAVALCETIPDGLGHQVRSEVYQVCGQFTQALKDVEEARLCDQAVSTSGASSELLESTIEVRNPVGSENVVIKDLICTSAKKETTVTFRSSGLMFWSKQLMDLRFAHGDQEILLHLVLEPVETGSDWKVAVEDEGTIEKLDAQRINAEVLTACLMGSC